MANNEPTGLQKSIIFGYSAAIAYLGYYSIEMRHGSILDYLRRDSVASASEHKSDESFFKFFQRNTGKGNSSKTLKTPKPQVVEVDEHDEKLDGLTDNDRKALSTLIDGL